MTPDIERRSSFVDEARASEEFELSQPRVRRITGSVVEELRANEIRSIAGNKAGLVTRRRLTLREIFVCTPSSLSILVEYDAIVIAGARRPATNL